MADLGTKRMEELRRLWKLEQLDQWQVGEKSREDPQGQTMRDIEKVRGVQWQEHSRNDQGDKHSNPDVDRLVQAG